jgi:hypothetical protein
MRVTQIVLGLVWFLGVYVLASFCSNVTYDHRALVIDGKRRVLISGSIHYPRSTPQVSSSLVFSVCIYTYLTSTLQIEDVSDARSHAWFRV